MGDRLDTIDMGRKVEAEVPLSVGGGELGLHLTQCDRRTQGHSIYRASIASRGKN